ncbi:MAG: site-specific integrase, partial [Acidimicrobiales bacterium]
VDVGPDPATGKRQQILRQGFANRKQAEAALSVLLHEVETGTVSRRSRITVGEFFADWLASQRQRLRPTTLRSYQIAADRITRQIGRMPLQALTPAQIEKLYTDLLENGNLRDRLAAKTVRNTHVVLRKALADAERLGLVPRNAAAAAKPPTAPRKEFNTWSTDELREFFAIARDDRLFAAYVLLATTGMRRGEVLGLRWGDIDFDAAQLGIVQTLTTVDFVPTFSPPKTARSRRVVYLDDQTMSVLKQHRRLQRQERLAVGEVWDTTNDLAFRDDLGRLLHPEWFSREFVRLTRLAGLPRIRLHDLRHTYATIALKAGVHPKVVSERLGHATVGITLDLYSHVTPAIARDAADVVASKIFELDLSRR